MGKLELDEIQGIIISGYKHLRFSHYLFLKIIDPGQTKKQLQIWSQHITTSDWPRENGWVKKPDPATNIAFTYTGLKKLGLPDTALNTFPNEFIEGMANPDRSRQLGDVEHNASCRWDRHWQRNFDQNDNPEQCIHILLILQTSDPSRLKQLSDDLQQQFEATGAGEVIAVEKGYLAEDDKEHFGFRDNIANPSMEGSPNMNARSQDLIKPGEFILGYPNELSTPEKLHLPPTPVVRTTESAKKYLPLVEYHNNDVLDLRDLGRNGSYLVFRKLYQDVDKFRQYFEQHFPDLETQQRMQAKMVGRWQSGVPLVLAPDRDPAAVSRNQIQSSCPDGADNLSHFNYRDLDPLGHRCPIGAHIRRANPRDALEDNAANSIKSVKRHRLMRRGALYGSCQDAEKGLLFMCINADIRRQFEFVQQSWIHSDKFNGLYGERDPLIGTRDPETCQMAIPQVPFQQKLFDLPDFVQLKGGDYFFLPSISAVNFLATLPDSDIT